MHNKKRNIISEFISTVLGIVLINFAFSSCERIYEDLAPCPHGVSLRFIYDYNMEYANAFAKKVDCLTLLVYDENGNYVDTRIVTGTELQDENYRMKLDLKQGNYHFVAYGGLACNKSSFLMKYTPGEGTGYTDLQVDLRGFRKISWKAAGLARRELRLPRVWHRFWWHFPDSALTEARMHIF